MSNAPLFLPFLPPSSFAFRPFGANGVLGHSLLGTWVLFFVDSTTDHCPTGAVSADCLEFRETEPPSPPPPLSYSFLLSVSGRSWSCHSCRGWQFARPGRIRRQGTRRSCEYRAPCAVRAHCSKRELRHRATRWTARYSDDKSTAQVDSGFPEFSLKPAVPTPVVSAWIKCSLDFVYRRRLDFWSFSTSWLPYKLSERSVGNFEDLNDFSSRKCVLQCITNFSPFLALLFHQPYISFHKSYV